MGHSEQLQQALVHIRNLASSEQNFHIRVAAEVLDATPVREEKARQLLSEELLKECKAFASWLKEPSSPFTEEGMLALDTQFICYLRSIGRKGAQLADDIASACKQWLSSYRQDPQSVNLYKLWLDPERPPYYCRYLPLLAEVLWEDRIEARFTRACKQLPALTQSVHRPLTKLMSPRLSVWQNAQQVALTYEGKTVAETTLLDPRLQPILLRGVSLLGSIYHHKLLRLLCGAGFNQWAEGKEMPHVIHYEGGATELAAQLKLGCKEAPTDLKAILHAQALLRFHLEPESPKPLIEIRKGRIEIGLNPPLMPHYTFQADRRERLLVPLAQMPPCVSAPQFYGRQSLVQMLVMEECTRQSLRLATEGTFSLTQRQWDDFCRQADLPASIAARVFRAWVADREDGESFLIRAGEDSYSLGKTYAKEQEFFRHQGLMRKQRQMQGRISARKRKLHP